MKKKVIAAAVAGVFIAACVPMFSGCRAELGYSLVEEEGEKYYVATCNGYAGALKGELEIPAYISEIPVKKIAEQGFAGSAVTKVIIPETVEQIQTAAFAYCRNLLAVEFAENSVLSEVGRGAFGCCEMLSEIILPDGVSEIGGMAFYECKSLTSFTFPHELTNIGDRAFAYCNQIDELIFHEKLEVIEFSAFYMCVEAKRVTFCEGLKKIGADAFSFCNALVEVILPASICDLTKTDENGDEYIEYGLERAAFQACANLEKIVVLSNVQTLRSAVFGCCPKLNEIWLPKTIKEVDGAVYVDNKPAYGHAFYGDPELENVYYAGTQEEWSAIKIDNKSITDNGVLSNNNALLNALKHYNSVYA